MNPPIYYPRCLFAVLTFAAILVGCAASPDSDTKPATSVKPIERVRGGITDLSADLDRTLASMKPLADEASFKDRSRRAAFAQNLQRTEQGVEALRADAKELRERASEYLILWSGDVATVGASGVGYHTDPRREARKDKYDQFVNEMVSARDTVLPLLDQLKTIESTPDAISRGERIRQAEADGAQAIRHLNDALAKLDELKALLQTSGS